MATTGQFKKGRELKLDVLRDSFHVAWARIEDAIAAINEAHLARLQLKVGDRVRVPANAHFPERVGVGLIRLGRQWDYAAALSNSAGAA